MPVGVEIFGADGSLKFSATDRLGRFLLTVNIGPGAGGVSVPGLNTGIPFIVVTARDAPTSSPSFQYLPTPPTITFNQAAQAVYWSDSSLPEGWVLTIGVY